MQTEKVKLSQVAANSDNPRTITQEKLDSLVLSILVLPKMLELRPVVVDSAMCALGGNMRLSALNRIASMESSKLFDILSSDDDFNEKTESERQKHLDWWATWRNEPYCFIVRADSLTESEKRQFIVKDNLSFGAWDWQKLTREFSPLKLQKWGMDGVPNFRGLNNPDINNASSEAVDAQSESFVEDGAVGTSFIDQEFSNLPPELTGVDIEPDKHEDIKGDDKTEYQRVILTYKEEDIPKLCALLGLSELTKVVYSLEELVPE